MLSDAPVNAGDYKVVVTISEGTNYTTDSAELEFTISKADITAGVALNGWIYGDIANIPTVSGNSGSGAVTYNYVSTDGAGYNSSEKPTNAGEYKLTITIAETANYSGGTAEVTFTISPKALTEDMVSDINSSYTYIGSAIAPTVTVKDGDKELVFGTDYTVSYGNNTTVAEGGTVTITGTGNYSGEVEVTFTISPKALTISASVNGSVAYGTAADSVGYTINYEGFVNGETAESVFGTNKPTASSSYTATTPAGTKVTITITVPEGAAPNYVITNSGGSFTVDKATAGSSQVPSAPTTGTLTYGQSLSEIKLEGGWQWVNGDTKPAVSDSNVTRYAVRIEVDDDNYDWTNVAGYENGYYTATVTVTVNAKEISATWYLDEVEQSGYSASVTYDGKAHNVTAAATGVNGESVTLTVTGGTQTAADTYTVTASVTNNANYVLSEASDEFTLTITKATVTGITFNGDTVEYDGQSHSLAISGTLPEGVTVSYEGNGKVDAGTYTVTAKFTVDGNHEPIADMTATLVISQRDISNVTLEVTGSYTYNGSEQKATFTVSDGDIAIAADDYEVSYSNNTSAGTAGITLTATSDGNYKGSISADFEIAKASLTVSGTTATDRDYDGTTDVKVTLGTVNGIAEGDNVTVNVSGTVVDADAGTDKKVTLTYTLSGEDAGNYIAPDDDGACTVDISAKAISAEWSYSADGVSATVISGDTSVAFGKTYTVSVTATGVNNESVTLIIAGHSGSSAALSALGDHALAASISPANGNYTLKNAQVTFSIITATSGYGTLEISGIASPVTYGDSVSVTAEYSGDVEGYTITYKSSDESVATVDVNGSVTLKKAGVFTITATWQCTGYADLTATTGNITVNAKQVSAVWSVDGESGSSVTYDGEAYAISASIESGSAVGTDDLSYALTISGQTSGQNVGSYTATASLKDEYSDRYVLNSETASFTLSIKQATNSWKTELSIVGWTYGETANTPAAEAEFGEVTFTYSDTQNGTYTSAVPTTAGSWYVKASVPGTDNYTGLEATAKFEIAKAAAVVPELPDLGDDEITYGEPVGGITLPGEWEWADPEDKPTVEEGENGIEVTIPVDDDNYDWTGVEGYDPEEGTYTDKVVVTVKPATPVVGTIAAQDSHVYGVTLDEISLTASGFTGLAADAQPEWVNGTTIPTVTNSGYAAKIAVDDDNYDWTGIEGYADGCYTKTVKVTITAAEHDTSDLKFEGATFEYDGTEHSIYVSGLPEGVTVRYEGNKQVNAGIYTVTAKFTVDGNHEPIPEMKATLVISQRDISNVTLTIYGSYQYTGKPVQPDWSISDSAAITEKDYAMALVNNTYAGVATLVVTGTRNYCGSASVTFDILKATPVVGEIAAQGSHVYGVTLDEITLTVSGFTGLAADAQPEWVNGTTIPTVTNEGYAAKIAVDDDNYDWTNVAGYADGCYTVAVDADIQKAPVTELPQPPVIKDELEEGEEVGNIELPEGWEWVDPEDKPTVEEGEEGIEVKIPVDDDNYDWTDIEGYDPEDGTYTDKVQVPVKEPQPEYGVIDIDLPATGAQSYEYGTSLKDIALVAGSLQGAAQGAEWEWAEESPSSVYPGVENTGYDVRIAVDTTNYEWTDVAGYADGYYTVHVNVSIYARDIAVSWSGTSFTYSGEARQPLAEVGAEQLVGNDKLQFAYTIAGEKVTDGKAINAGSYTVTASIDDANYTIASGSECAFTIARAVVEIPASGGEIESNGEEQEFFPEGFDGDIMDIEGNRVTEGGDYDAEISLKDPDNYEWSDGTTDSKQIGFTVVGDDYIDLLWLIILLIVLIVIELILLILIIRRRKEIDDGDAAKGGSSRTESMMAGAPMALLAVKVIPWQIATIAVLAVIFVALAIADIVLFAAARRAEKESGLDDIVDENDIQG